MSKKKKVGIVFLVLLVIALIVAGIFYFTVRKYYSNTNYMSDEEVKEMIEQMLSGNKKPENSEDGNV